MSLEDQPTQQIRRAPPPAPMPGPLDVAGQPESQPDEHDTTEVMSLDQLFEPTDPAPTATVAPVTSVQPAAEPVEALPSPVETAPPPMTDESPSSAASGAPSLAQRLSADARAAAQAGWARGRGWLREADNMLVAATVIVTLLLLAVVATL